MKIMRVTCDNCLGFGHLETFEDTGENTLQRKDVVCKVCNGKGYIKYAVFSVEEAEAILKHCGLRTEKDIAEVVNYENLLL